MPSKGSHMGSEISGRITPQRARLSDITNTAPLGFSKHREDDHVVKARETELHKELANLRKSLAEKERLIHAQKVNMEKLWNNFNRKTKQNEDIIRHNGCLYKELMQTRDKLKVLQHENMQMASAHKAIKSELQAKLAKALEQAALCQKEAGPCGIEKAPCDMQSTMPDLFSRLAESRARRTVSSCEASTEPLDVVKDESSMLSAACRSTSRRRVSLSYKEPSLKTKLRQAESTPGQVKPFHRRENGIPELQKVCEEEPNMAPAAMPSSTEDIAAETLLAPCPQIVLPTESCSLSVVSGDVLEDENPSSSIVPDDDANLSSGTQLLPCAVNSLSLVELPRGRSRRRSAVGTVTSYKETPLNAKLRRS
ncbi:hypothetical protein L7F22_059730 [Adiantum nelumboides]|nr:hypothetical protein [Adiantum nelumboides]